MLSASLGFCVMMAASLAAKSSARQVAAQVQSAEALGYRVTNSIDLSTPAAAPSRRIELLEDQRFTSTIREKWRGADAAMSCAEPADPELASLCASIKERALRGAVVRLIGDNGAVLDQREFQRELAEISPVHLYESRRQVFAVTVDFGVGFGSYAGPTTFFVEPSGGRLQWLAASDFPAAKPAEVALARTLKSDWQSVARADARGFDILAVHCRPDLGAPIQPDHTELPFVVIYERYTFDGARWLRKERREPGLWEVDRGFPSSEKFPL